MAGAELTAAIRQVREQLPAQPIVVDLQGAKMRVGRFPRRRVRVGERVAFRLAAEGDAQGAVPVPHPELFRAAQVGELLRCDDDRLRFEVTETTGASLWSRCAVEGTLEPRRAINLQDHPVDLEALCQIDRDQLARTAAVDNLSFAFSFMKDGREAAWVRECAPASPVIGKIERREAIDGLATIASQVDGLWICRGDLGAQLGQAALARAVAHLRPDGVDVPVLMAGQVLEHLTEHATPTRSEVCHLYDLLQRGFDGIVLSDETAIGTDPVRAVEIASQLIRAWRAPS
jgi:pyruvate kinase